VHDDIIVIAAEEEECVTGQDIKIGRISCVY